MAEVLLEELIASLFDRLQRSSQPTRPEIAHVSRGEFVGESALLSTRLSNFTVKASEPSTLLPLVRQELALKLQQDPAMGARFYRILLEGLISRLGYGQKATYRLDQTFSQTARSENELDDSLIDSLILGGAQFDWMLKRLNVRGVQ